VKEGVMFVEWWVARGGFLGLRGCAIVDGEVSCFSFVVILVDWLQCTSDAVM
jgi:hypothetical protein